MIVYVYPSDHTGCGWYRLMYPAGVLQAAGHDVRVIPPGSQKHLRGFLSGDEVIGAEGPPDADVIVLQRPCQRKLVDSIPFLREQGIAVVVDVDDDLAHIHPANPAFKALHPSQFPENNWLHLARACRAATLVTTSTTALAASYAGHGRSVVLSNCVPGALLEVERVDADWIGWPGFLPTHPDDLDDVSGALHRLMASGNRFRVVGDGEGVARAVGVPEVEHTGAIAFHDWSSEVAKIGVGIAPLSESRFNRAKSWLKPLHMGALGVPWVASDLPEYRKLADMGGGTVVGRKGWVRAVQHLTGSAEARQEASEAARSVASFFTYEDHAWRWLEAWEAAYESQRGRALVSS